MGVDIVKVFLENREVIETEAANDEKNFFWACCCRVIRRIAKKKLKELGIHEPEEAKRVEGDLNAKEI